MKKFIILTLLFICNSFSFIRTNAQVKKSSSSVLVDIEYLESLPTDFSTKKDEKNTLVIFLHGSGERTNNVMDVAKWGPPKHVKEGKKYPFVLISPQLKPERYWDSDILDKWLDQLIVKYNIDPKKIYLTGLSMGGYGTWDWVSRKPNRFAAVMPVCGGGDINKMALIKDLPIWVWHGDQDKAVNVEQSRRLVNKLKELGSTKIKYSELPGVDHFSWVPAYKGDAWWKWMLSNDH